MKNVNAERVTIGGETAWLFSNEAGWKVRQGPYEVYVTYAERNGVKSYALDWFNHSPRRGDFEGGLIRFGTEPMEKAQFLEEAERVMAVLRRRDAPPTPPAKPPSH